MLYTMNVLLSLGLSVELPMVVEVNSMGAVQLANSWSISGRTRHISLTMFSSRIKREKSDGCQMVA